MHSDLTHKPLMYSRMLAGAPQWDNCRGDPAELQAAEQRIRKVAMPAADPVFGTSTDAPLMLHWKQQQQQQT